MRRADRLFAIILALRGRKVRRAEDIARDLEVSVRTVYRDLADLQMQGVPIDGERGVGYLLRDSHFLPPLALTVDEWDALHWGVSFAAAHGDDAFAASARSLLAKLEAASPQPRRSSIAIHAELSAPRIKGLLAALRPAIAGRRHVQLSYRDVAKTESEREVRPLELQFWGLHWTLTAWCDLRCDFRVFRLDRIAQYTVLDTCFRDKPGKQIEDYLAQLQAKCG